MVLPLKQPPCQHTLCHQTVTADTPLRPFEVEQIIACMLEQGVLERVPGTNNYRVAAEHRKVVDW